MHRNCIAALCVWVERVLFTNPTELVRCIQIKSCLFTTPRGMMIFCFFISERAKKNWQFVLMNQFDEQRKESSYIVLFFRNSKNVGVKNFCQASESYFSRAAF